MLNKPRLLWAILTVYLGTSHLLQVWAVPMPLLAYLLMNFSSQFVESGASQQLRRVTVR